MQVRNQMGSYIGNFDGHQKEALMRFLYASMLYADTDLSKCLLAYEMASAIGQDDDPVNDIDLVAEAQQALLQPKDRADLSIDIDPEAGLAAADHQAAIREFWSSLLQLVKGVADFDTAFEAIDIDGSGDISLDELRRAMKRSEPSATEAEVRQRFEDMDVDHDGVVSREEFVNSPQRPQALKVGELRQLTKLNSHIFLDTQSGLMKRLMSNNDGGRDMSLQVAKGHVPCSLVAMHIVITCSDVSKETGDSGLWYWRIFRLLLLMALSWGFLGAFTRAMDGQSAFGANGIEKLFYASKTLPECFFGALLMAFPLNGCFWLYRQLLMAQRLLDLIEVPRSVDVRWRSSGTQEENCISKKGKLLPLDLSNPQNVQGWASLRRTIYGRNFAPSVELKMQCYITITLFIFLISAAANTLGTVSGNNEETLPVDYVIVSVLRPTFLSVPIISQIFLAYKINRYAHSYAEALNAKSLKCTARAASLANMAGQHLEEIERLGYAAAMLSTAAAEIESEAESRPMRVVFVKAEPAAASMIISAILSIVALQIYGMRSLL